VGELGSQEKPKFSSSSVGAKVIEEAKQFDKEDCLAILVGNDKYTHVHWSYLAGAKRDLEDVAQFLEPFFTIEIIRNSKDILDDVLNFVEGLNREVVRKLKKVVLYYVGHGLNMDTLEVKQHMNDPENIRFTGFLGDGLIGVDGNVTSKDRLVSLMVKTIAYEDPTASYVNIKELNTTASFLIWGDHCRNYGSRSGGENPFKRLKIKYKNQHYKNDYRLDPDLECRVMYLSAALESDSASDKNSFTQKLIRMCKERPEGKIPFHEISEEFYDKFSQDCSVKLPENPRKTFPFKKETFPI